MHNNYYFYLYSDIIGLSSSMLNGDSISAAQAQELASLLSDQSIIFTLEIVEVNVTKSESDDSGAPLSTPATHCNWSKCAWTSAGHLICSQQFLLCALRTKMDKLIARISIGEQTVYRCAILSRGVASA